MSYQTPRTTWNDGDGVRSSDMNRIEGNIEALQKVMLTGTIDTSAWSSTAPFTCTINNANLKELPYTVVLKAFLDTQWASATPSEVVARTKAYNCVDRVAFSNGTMTFYCYRFKPSASFVYSVKGA